MKKIKKINLGIDKEVIASLSGNEMNEVRGGATEPTCFIPPTHTVDTTGDPFVCNKPPQKSDLYSECLTCTSNGRVCNTGVNCGINNDSNYKCLVASDGNTVCNIVATVLC